MVSRSHHKEHVYEEHSLVFFCITNEVIHVTRKDSKATKILLAEILDQVVDLFDGMSFQDIADVSYKAFLHLFVPASIFLLIFLFLG